MRAVLTRSVLAAVAAGSLVMAAGCSGNGANSGAAASHSPSVSASPSASASAAAVSGSQQPTQPPPAGYQWVGSSSQGVWMAVPKSWVAVNLAQLSLGQALQRVSLKGISSAAMRADITTLKQHNALFVADLNSAATSANHFATNVNAFCSPEVIEPGPGAVSVLDNALRIEYQNIHAHLISLKNTQVSTTAVVIQTEITLQSTAGYTITELQTADLTNHGTICEVTLSTDNPAKYLGTLQAIISTLQVG